MKKTIYILFTAFIVSSMLSGCKGVMGPDPDHLKMGDIAIREYIIGASLEELPEGLRFADQKRPTPVNYKVTGSVVGKCEMEKISVKNQNYLKAEPEGVTYIYDKYDQDFLIILCGNAPDGDYVANVHLDFEVNGQKYSGDQTYNIKKTSEKKFSNAPA
ncbi:hypothetical protein ACFPDQ_04485 [Pseudofrancisella aestuarii]|uniref:Lipoprotein n=1 Tax=Pseudofrancisella aestuarii TaxID=2670347 RepID=A0ABV9TBW1_9GAMM|nr:hypothetical protein [Pseudofrancisella aestuarii]